MLWTMPSTDMRVMARVGCRIGYSPSAERWEAREAARTLEPLNENRDKLEGENRGNGNGGNGGNGNGGNGGNGNRNGNHGMNYGGFMPVARDAGRPVAESRGVGTSKQVGRGGKGRGPRRGNDERVDELNYQRNDQGMRANGGVKGVNGNVEGVNGGISSPFVTPKSMKIERYMYGLAPQIHGMVAATEPKTMQNAVQISSALTDEAVRNGSIMKVEKRGNVGEPSKDKNGRDDNKRTRTRNAFAITANPVGRENTGA
ncbi:hypothetical protein Tco_1066228 [Tanacetum coccineum]|uniref:Uncharacterized protein n=1 Tax=Tanacetum coccineum TaxID=301880 RepID=A0ABQ5H9G5_9ASTR